MIKINNDGFVWLTVNQEKALHIWQNNVFDLYTLYDDGSESLIETSTQIANTIACGFSFGIEVGQLPKDETTKDLEFIKSIYFESEVCMYETLASIPADGLTFEEAFELYAEAMKWCEGDRFFQVFENGDKKEIGDNTGKEL